jgi:hypothetical protein
MAVSVASSLKELMLMNDLRDWSADLEHCFSVASHYILS